MRKLESIRIRPELIDFASAKAQHKAMEIDLLARVIWTASHGSFPKKCGKKELEALAAMLVNKVMRSRQKRSGRFKYVTLLQACCHELNAWMETPEYYELAMTVNESKAWFPSALIVAKCAVEGVLEDVTHGADHCHFIYRSPQWAYKVDPICVIGNFVFYNLFNHEKNEVTLPTSGWGPRA